jgi:hypothetical protein
MNNRAILSVLFLTLFSCSSSYFITNHPQESYERSRQYTNHEFKGRIVDIVLHDSTLISAANVTVEKDTTCWINLQTYKKSTISTAEINYIQWSDKGLGFIEGLGLGTALGFGGLAAGCAANSGRTGIALLLAGPIVGTITGTSKGHVYRYSPAFTENMSDM